MSAVDPAAPLFHLLSPADWDAAQHAGWLRPDSLQTEGFVHFSFQEQVLATAQRHYGSEPELVAVEFDVAKLGSPVVEEDSYGSGQRYPHVYAPIPIDAAVAVHPVRRTDDGGFVFV